MTDRSLTALTFLLQEFANEREWNQFHSPKNLAMALSVETSELMEHFQWLTEEQSDSLQEKKLMQIREEIGDVLIYLTLLAHRLGIEPLDAAFEKLEVNRIKYPVKKARGSSKKYSEL